MIQRALQATVLKGREYGFVFADDTARDYWRTTLATGAAAMLDPSDPTLCEEFAKHMWDRRGDWISEPPPFVAGASPTAASWEERGEYLTRARLALGFLQDRILSEAGIANAASEKDSI